MTDELFTTAACALQNHRSKVHDGYRWLFILIAVTWLLGLPPSVAWGQTYLENIGVPPFAKTVPVENGFVDASNGRLHLEIPMGVFPQRGGRQVKVSLMYDSSIWTPITYYGYWSAFNSYSYGLGDGWRLVESGGGGTDYSDTQSGWCYADDDYAQETFANWTYIDSDGTQHAFSLYTAIPDYPEDCGGEDRPSDNGFALDASGYYMTVSSYTYATVYAPDGTIVSGGSYVDAGYHWYIDPNGNGDDDDTLGRTLVTTTVSANMTTITVPNAQGGTSSYTLTTGTIDVHTNFNQSSLTEYSGTITVITAIELPDGTTYTFDYDHGTTAGHYGQLTSMKLPTMASGTSIGYSWSLFTDAQGNKYPWISTRTTPDGTWTYTPTVVSSCSTGYVNCPQTFKIAKPNSDTILYSFYLNGGAWMSEAQYYTGSSNLVATTTQCWNFVTITNGTCTPSTTTGSGATGVQKLAETTTLPVPGGTSISKTNEYSYDGYGNTAAIEEWNYYTGTLPGYPDRLTDITYIGTEFAENILNKPTNVTVTNKSGSTVAETNYAYDGSSLVSATSKENHDDTDYGTSMTARGNLTQVQRLVSGTSTFLTTSMTYDMTGQVRTSTDSKGNQTSFDYTDNLFDDPGDGSSPTSHSVSTATNAYLKTITHPTVSSVTLTETFGYYYGTGQVASVTDANGNTTYSHFHDYFNRPTSMAPPNGEWTRMTYTPSTTTNTLIDLSTGTTSSSASPTCSVCRHDQTALDNMGRVISQRLVNDPDGETYVATSYDSNGRVATVSNPYRGSSNGVETSGYDGLDRITQVEHADGNYAYTYYGANVGSGGGASSQSCSSSTYGLGYPVLVVDEVGNKRQTWTDGFGRVIETDEPNASGTLNVNTCYSYDANNNLTGVAGQSSQTRSYSYDLLSRITSSTTPESGTTYFYYTTSGGSLCSGDPTAVCRRTDARSITTTYAYDALNRLISMSYNDSSPTTPTVSYYYDQTSYNTLATFNGKGRRTGMSDGSGQTAWSYDSIGDVTDEKRTINGVTTSVSYAYNLDGTISTVTYPGGDIVSYWEGNAQRMTAATDASITIYYATAPSSGVMYAPTGSPANILHGYVSGGFAGITESYTYNNRLQVTAIEATSSGGTPLNLSYSYGSSNNGNIATQTNNATSGRTQSYTYDTLNRLLSAQAAATSGGDCWGQNFGNNATPPTLAADALNNLLNMNNTQCSSPALSVSGSTSTNRFTTTGYSYDYAGNNTADGLNGYTYDAENRIRSADVSGTYYCYIYDGNGMRVEKATASGSACSSPTAYELYWRSTSGETIAETDGSGSTSNSSYHEYIFFARRRVAQSTPSSSTVYYYFADHLGSTRVVTNSSGVACYEGDFLPYGAENTPSGFSDTCSTSYKFTGYERDSETSLDYAFARYYNQRMGRFQSGDPLAGDISDPQALNRYSYVRNNPISFIDPLGLYTCSEFACSPFGDPFFWYGGGGCNNASGDVCSLSFVNIPTAPPPKVPLRPGSPAQPPQSPGKQNIFSCAAGVGDKLSIAGGLHALGIGTSGVGGFITDALGGNAFSGATNLISSLGSGSAGGHNVFYNMAQGVVAGPGQGVLPPGVSGPLGASASGVATNAIAGTAWSSVTGAGQTLTTLGGEASLASTAITAAEFASGVAEAKYAYDFLTYAGGAAACAVGLAH